MHFTHKVKRKPKKICNKYNSYKIVPHFNISLIFILARCFLRKTFTDLEVEILQRDKVQHRKIADSSTALEI